MTSLMGMEIAADDLRVIGKDAIFLDKYSVIVFVRRFGRDSGRGISLFFRAFSSDCGEKCDHR